MDGDGELRLSYVINEEQAETVRMIFDLYLQGYGSMRIAGILTERKRKTASGLVKWSVSNIMRAIKNATYTGTKCYNKSRSNNFLEQKGLTIWICTLMNMWRVISLLLFHRKYGTKPRRYEKAE